MTRRPAFDDDRGSALVEFFWLAVLLMVPLVYLVITAATVQQASFAVTQAAQQAARAYATAGSDATGETRAELAAGLAMRDQGVDWALDGRVVACGDCTYQPGSTYDVVVSTRVALPLVPAWLCGRACVAGITVSARHVATLGCFAGTGVPVPGSPC